MADTRDPETDQPEPKPGGYPVQAVLIEAIRQRMEFGLKKYGRPLETENGRDPLRDMWEEMLDMISYFTQFILEQGVELPGLEKFTRGASPETWPEGILTVQEAAEIVHAPAPCEECKHPVHFIGACQADAPGGKNNCQCGYRYKSCSNCHHEPHEPGHCQSKALNLGCGCLNEAQSS